MKTAKAMQGILSVTNHRRSIREPTQYQRTSTKTREGATCTDSGSSGQTLPMGHNVREPIKNAGKFETTANLKGHGHTWKRAVECQRVSPPKKMRLRIPDRCQRPIPPKPAANPHWATGKRRRNRVLFGVSRFTQLFGHQERPKRVGYLLKYPRLRSLPLFSGEETAQACDIACYPPICTTLCHVTGTEMEL